MSEESRGAMAGAGDSDENEDSSIEAGSFTGQWLITQRPGGELLAADLLLGGFRIIAFVEAHGLDPRAGEAALHTLLARVLESRDRAGSAVLVRRMFLGMSVVAAMGGGDDVSRALLLVESEAEVACAYRGDRAPQVSRTNGSIETSWFLVAESSRQRSFAFVVPTGQAQGLRIEWPAFDEETDAVVAEWSRTLPGAISMVPPASMQRYRFFEWLDRIVDRKSLEGDAPRRESRLRDAPGVVEPIEDSDPEVSILPGVDPERTIARMIERGPIIHPDLGPTADSPGIPEREVSPAPVSEVAEGRAVMPRAPISRAAESSSAPRSIEPAASAPTPSVAGSSAASSVARAPLRPSWPSAAEIARGRTSFWKPVSIALLVLALFAGGWYLGRLQNAAKNSMIGGGSSLGWLPFGPATYECAVTSEPAGAMIAVDEKPIGSRTPAVLRLRVGPHRVDVGYPETGSTGFTVVGTRGQRISLEAPLWGTLRIGATDPLVPVSVWVDGAPRGVAPLTLERMEPGPHEIEFTAPGHAPWGQAVTIAVRGSSEITAQPFREPATGRIEVRARLGDDQAPPALQGAAVWVDGRAAGSTPLTLELSAGPHSIRVAYRGQDAPVQVIDLPGGNQRFADFQFTAGGDHPRLSLASTPASLPRDQASVISAKLEGVAEVNEMWLHVRTPEGTWRRYPMNPLPSPGGVVGVVVFPNALLDEHGRAPYYVSALTATGDEYFTELQNADDPAGGSRPRRRAPDEATP